jgi:predicted phage-related endonuclease
VSDADFLERRRHRIGASDIAAGLTGCFSSSPASVIATKLGLLEDRPPTDRMRLGLALEDRVIDSAAALLGATVTGRQVEVTHPVYEWLVATTDALVTVETGDDRRYPLEVKTTSNPAGYPADYLTAQLTAQMLCCDVGRGFTAVRNLILGTLEVREHELDREIAVAVVEMAQALWDHLQTGIVPSPIFPSDADLWGRLYPRSSPETVELPADLVAELVEARADLKTSEARADLLEAQVKEALGEAEAGTVDGVLRVRWPTVTSRRLDLKALEAVAPDLVDQHRKDSSTRRFTVVISPIKQTRKEIPS